MDFYEPEGDTETERPLLIWVHGGSFIGGDKTDFDMVTFSERFAKKGYACASINYRLGFFPIDSANAVKAVVRATQDLRAAIRYFYKDKQTTNQYKIDTNNIFIGGSFCRSHYRTSCRLPQRCMKSKIILTDQP